MQAVEKSLFRRIERGLQTVAGATRPLATIRKTAQFLVDQFADELRLTGGRIYSLEDQEYEVVETFGRVSKEPLGVRLSRSYGAFEPLFDHGAIVMDRSDPDLNPSIEEELGTRNRFAAILVAEGQFVLSFDVDEHTEPDDLISALNLFRLAINQKVREDRTKELIEDARHIQASILPRRAPRLEGLDIDGRSVAAETVGGDFFDFITLSPTMIDAVVADAVGHGLPAALLVRDVYTGLRMGLLREYKVTRTLERLNNIIHRSRLATKFITLVLAEVHADGTVLYTNAGHPAPLLVRAGGPVQWLGKHGLVLGPRPDVSYPIDMVRLGPGDSLLLYSDGITEALSPAGGEFGTRRLADLVSLNRHLPAESLVSTVFDSVNDFSQRTTPVDDQTLVVVKLDPTRRTKPGREASGA